MAALPIGNPGDLQPPPGVGAQSAIGGFWPSISETAIQEVADEHRTAAKSFSDYADMLQQQLAHSINVLEGQGGNARIAQLTTMRDHAVDSADHTASKVDTAESYKSTVIGFKRTLISIGDAAQEDWHQARSSKRVFNPAPFQAEAASAYSTALGDIATAPPPLPVPGEDTADAQPGDHQSQKDEPNRERPESVEKQVGEGTPEGKKSTDSLLSEKQAVVGEVGEADSSTGQTDRLVSEAPAKGTPVDTGSMPGASVGGVPATGAGVPPMSGGSPARAGGSSLSGLKPPAQMPSAGSLSSSLGGKSLSDAATAPAASVSDAFGSSGGGGGSLSSAANSFQSGLASGMGSSGAVSPALEKFSGGPQHPAVAPLSAAGSPQGPVVAAQGGPVATPGAAPGPVMGGGGAMAPMIPPSGAGAGGGALPPYVPPGAGTGGAVPPAGASTAAAAGSSAPGPVQQGASTPAGGGAPVVAGSGAATAAGLSDVDVNPDLLLARRVLDGLVRGTNATPETFNGGWIRWAVAVLRTPSGATHTVIASSVGGGVYLPESAFFPFTARIAPLDPALPWGWGEQFMGWDRPTVLVAEHANAVCESVVGLRRSAMVTTEEDASRPAGWDDFVTVPMISILHSAGAAPLLDGGEYRHRLASLDAGVDSQINVLVKRGWGRAVAGPITEAVVAAADQAMASAVPGLAPLIDSYDHENVLGPLRRGEQVDWEAHYRHLAAREGGAVLHPMLAGGLLDLDDSEASNHSRRVYWHYYRAGLLAEMLRCWRVPNPSLFDVVYCAVAAGFGQTVSAVLAQVSSGAAAGSGGGGGDRQPSPA